ncbi:hypothetical protein AB0F25_38640 [Streptomyces wedmorensis]|uniref:hypothetical protein n=1 Tax=Streptomyces wedmorensis TaxID=43759 RepID=UPI0034480C1F
MRDPLAKLSEEYPSAPMLFMGGLIGAFLIGRPFPLFRRLHRWTTKRPSRSAALMAAAFIAAGVFLVLYWDLRILARRDLIWYPMAPWAA